MRIIIAAAALVALSGCSVGSKFTPRPVSIGSGANGLKRAPCACNKVKQLPGLPDWLMQANKKDLAAKAKAEGVRVAAAKPSKDVG